MRWGNRAGGLRALGVCSATVLMLAACSGGEDGDQIGISGSATVAPITSAVAAEGGYPVEIASEGTTDGFERFCAGETAINDASTPIPGEGQRTDYVAMCERSGVEYIELPIALDALSLITNQSNRFAADLSIDELRKIWEPESTVSTWSDVRPQWPDEPIGLYGRPDGSGTFEVFTHVVSGQAGAIRDDYRSTDDLAELARWIAEDEYGLGFMGIGNYLAADEDYRDRITNVAIDGVEPTLANVQAGRYGAFTRPLLIYVSTSALDEDERVGEFVEYYLAQVADILPREFFYALPVEAYTLAQERFEARETGTMYGGDPFSDQSVLDLLDQN